MRHSGYSPRARPAAAPRADKPPGQWSAIYAVVRAIPRGKVATYGQVAELAGIASGHRIAARAMRNCPEQLPWQRVVGKKDARRGQINIGDPDHAGMQRALLEGEGIVLDENGCITLERYGWQPRQSAHK